MSDHDFPPTTVAQFLIATVGGLLMPLLVIFLIAKLVCGIQAKHIADTDPAIANNAVVERIKPVGDVAMAGAVANTGGQKSGEVVFKEICVACHGSGALGSPKVGDKGAWGSRIAQGYDTLVQHALNGIRAMPPRGGGADLSDNEVAAAVVYMANQAGANFKAPAAK